MTFDELLKGALDIEKAKTPAQRAADVREQTISFVWGNLALMKDGPKLSREQIGELYDRRKAAGDAADEDIPF